jgi:hypothetical protein
MNKANNIHNQNKNKNSNRLFVASIAIAVVALTLFVSPMLNVDDALATHNKKNKAKQSIDQSQSSNQYAGCLSGETTFISCNNVSFQHQKNSGNNALAQQGGQAEQGGNSAEQSISQSQSSSQNSQVVSGADTIGSGNNINVQSQENTGSNALAQG